MKFRYDAKKQRYVGIPAEHPLSMLLNSSHFAAMITFILLGCLARWSYLIITPAEGGFLTQSGRNTASTIFFILGFISLLINILAYYSQKKLREEDIEELKKRAEE